MVSTTVYLKYNADGAVLRDHELPANFNRFNANLPSAYSTTKIVDEGNTQLTAGNKDDFKYALILWEKIPNKANAWYDSVYTDSPSPYDVYV